ncbi:DUF6891 domain-containing protein [Paraliomyxa miuraensis]|uniref:DUF6891 domain-containing protein n=1 Tax=Paraliomyxa miuraensis TaxID=376150 RepID=UPI00225AB018|nr:hypothetical protein [Paraliomyxa miuraensis]MCX4246396.1 hypothetical protein [Paraliomyxa miuraensis]
MATEERIREHIERTLDVDIRSGYGSEARVLERLREQVRDEFRNVLPAEREAEVERWMTLARRELAAQRELEESWTEPTVNDHLDAAFVALRRQGIVALQDAGYTMSDGWEDVHEVRDRIPRAWGGVFFHRQDVERAVEGGGLLLAFGAFATGDDHESESLRLATQTCEVLAAHDIATEWNGTLKQRIRVLPFEWRKRRWTPAPDPQR